MDIIICKRTGVNRIINVIHVWYEIMWDNIYQNRLFFLLLLFSSASCLCSYSIPGNQKLRYKIFTFVFPAYERKKYIIMTKRVLDGKTYTFPFTFFARQKNKTLFVQKPNGQCVVQKLTFSCVLPVLAFLPGKYFGGQWGDTCPSIWRLYHINISDTHHLWVGISMAQCVRFSSAHR